MSAVKRKRLRSFTTRKSHLLWQVVVDCSLFKDSRKGAVACYPEGMKFDKPGTVMFSDFKLADGWFVAMDSGFDHQFTFNEGISFLVYCKNQEEIDFYRWSG